MPQVPEPVRDIFDADGRGLQHHGLRRANERAVMTIIAFNPGVSNAEISRLSGLAPQTVSAILADLDEAGLLSRGEVLRGRRGQPATPIFLRADGAYAVGCEIGWRHADVVLLDMYTQVLGHVHKDYDYPDARTLIGDLGEAARSLMAGLSDSQRTRLTGMGVAMPTEMWRYLDVVDAPPEQRALWEATDVAAELSRATGLEVSVYNDGNAACWAELIAIPRPRPADFIYLLISTYVGAGIVGQGTLWEGTNGNSANLGAMLVNDGTDHPEVVHFVASISAFQNRLEAAGHPRPTGSPRSWNWASFEPVLTEWIETAASTLARVIFNTMAVTECRLAIVDGVMPRPVVERLTARIDHHLQRLPVALFVAPKVTAGHLGGLAPAIGAAELPLYRRYFSRTIADIAG